MDQRVGYARVSTDDPHLQLPRDVLTKGERSTIFEGLSSGKTTLRPEFVLYNKVLRAVTLRGVKAGLSRMPLNLT